MMSTKRPARSDEGQDLLEYALLVSLIAVGAIASVQLLGDAVSGVLWGTLANNF